MARAGLRKGSAARGWLGTKARMLTVGVVVVDRFRRGRHDLVDSQDSWPVLRLLDALSASLCFRNDQETLVTRPTVRTLLRRTRRNLLRSPTAILNCVLVVIAASLAAAPAGAQSSAIPHPADGQDPAWKQSVAAAMAAKEYEFTPGETGANFAPNRSCNLRTQVNAQGIELNPRSAGGWSVAMRTSRLGRPRSMREVQAGESVATANRAEIRRPGFVEWYVNDTRGVEQGFTLTQRQDGEGPLLLEMQIETATRAELTDGGNALSFHDPADGLVLRYAGLVVLDAEGTTVPARMALDGSTLRIEVEDQHAIYPLTIDPVMNTPSWTAESNQAGALLGSVATAGDVNGDGYSDVLVGAWRYDNGQTDEGAAWLYLGSPSGLSSTPVLQMEGNQTDALFGTTVAPAGDVNRDGFADWLVSAIHYTNGEHWEGRVFLYLGSSNPAATTPAWTAEGNQIDAFFGTAAATAGDVNGDGFDDVIIGAYYFDNGQLDEGQAFLYLGSANGLGATPAWTHDGNEAGAAYGYSVAGAGDVNADGYADVIIGAPNMDYLSPDIGVAHLFLGSAAGLGTTPAWSHSGYQAGAHFGYSVAGAGDMDGDGYADVIVGAPNAVIVSTANEGGIYCFAGTPTGLSGVIFDHGSGQTGSNYGARVATAGDVNGDGYADILVGAPNWGIDQGLVELYLGAPGFWTGTPAWSKTGQVNSFYGWSVATAGDVNGDGFSDVLVGAYGWDNPEADEGMAFVYHSFGDSYHDYADWNTSPAQGFYGFTVAAAGDVNADGYDDVLVSAPYYSSGETEEGRVWLYLGSENGLSRTAAWTFEINQAYAHFGYAMAGLGDVNGDGYDDVAISAPWYDYPETDEGVVWVFPGAPGGLWTSPVWWFESNIPSAHYGFSVAAAGDVNGDGYADLVVGAPGAQPSRTLTGILYGSTNWFSGPPSAVQVASGLPTWVPDNSNSLSPCSRWAPVGFFRYLHLTDHGFAVASGDLDGDGYNDVLISSPTARQFSSCQGTFATNGFVCTYENVQCAFFAVGALIKKPGGVGGGGLSSMLSPGSYAIGSQFGYSSALVDLDGDARQDCLVGDPGDASFWYLASGQAWGQVAGLQGTRFGHSVTGLGDSNRNGRYEFAVGAPGTSISYLGSVLVFEQPASSSPPSLLWHRSAVAGRFGHSVAGVGDVNGDGFTDLLVGAPETNNAFLYYGNDSKAGGDAGLDRMVRQWRTDGSAPVGRGGRSDVPNGIRIQATGRTAAGRGKLHFEWELKPHGVPFDGSLSYRGTAVDTGRPGTHGCRVGFDRVMGGLLPDRPYHWRLRTTSSSPFFPHSPWMTLPRKEASEIHFRTPPSGCNVSYNSVGIGIGGSAYLFPSLAGAGTSCLTAGYGWQVTNALGGATGVVIVGFTPLDVPVLGGRLYASPDVTMVMTLGGSPNVPGSGTASQSLGLDLFPFTGVTLHLQAAIIDPYAVQGIALTNGLRLTINP